MAPFLISIGRVMNKVIKRFASETVAKTIEAEGIDSVVKRLIEIAKDEVG